MIVGFKHKGLRRLYDKGETGGVRADQVRRIRQVLFVLDRARSPEDAEIVGFRLHPLKGNYRGYWSLSVSGNWRIVFRMDGHNVTDVDLVDYH